MTKPKPTPLITSMSQVRDLYLAEVEGFMGDRQRVAFLVHEHIRRATDRVMLAALGFRESFGRLEIDRVNGQMMPFSKWLVEHIVESAKVWFSTEFIAKDLLPKVGAKGRAELERVYRETYKGELERRVQAAATSKAEEDALRFIEELETLDVRLPSPAELPATPAPTPAEESEDDDDEGFFAR